MSYLLDQNEWQYPKKPPVPCLILLDLNFPLKFLGKLQELQQNPTLKKPSHYRSDIFKQ